MDIVSHGLWTNVVYLTARRRDRWWAVVFALLPDLIPFGPFFFEELTTHGIGNGPPQFTLEVYAYIWGAYQLTHSLVVFGVALVGVMVVRCLRGRKQTSTISTAVKIVEVPTHRMWQVHPWVYLPMLAWGLHILTDIPTHRRTFFPTPFFWPFSDYTVDAISWANPRFFYPNLLALVVVYLVIGIRWMLQRMRRT